uniref:Cuticle protein n=1 Tax=Heliothis virescens TaxID=7102 RepID=A0A2A4JH84_HELVI
MRPSLTPYKLAGMSHQQAVFVGLRQTVNMFKFLIFVALLAFASAKPLVLSYSAPIAAAYTAPVAAAYTAPVAYSAYSAYSPVAYSAYSYASPYTYYI